MTSLKIFFPLLLVFSFLMETGSQTINRNVPLRFLALGDSYTIGQSVQESERWPVQLGRALTNQGVNVEEVRIIAQTGWRTDNLQSAIDQSGLEAPYNLVSLLIGVNNQYQGRSIEVYEEEFEALLKTAIRLAGNDARKVMVLSIPDYAYTPFGGGNNNISRAIDRFNEVKRRITSNHNVAWFDITPISRRGLSDPSLVANDGLHPSGEMYGLWVEKIMRSVQIVSVTGVSELSLTESITILPRQIKVNIHHPSTILKVYNLAGSLVIQKIAHTRNGEMRVSTDGLPRGLYIVALESGGQMILNRKLVVR